MFDFSFSEKNVKELVGELVPEAERGKNLTKFLNTSVRRFITTDDAYENILIRVYGITRPEPAGDMVATITWRKRVCTGAPQPAATALKPKELAETVDQKNVAKYFRVHDVREPVDLLKR